MATGLSKQQAIVLDLLKVLAGIQMGNNIQLPDGSTYNYKTDIGKKVYHWRDEIIQKSEGQAVNIKDQLADLDVDEDEEDDELITNTLLIEVNIGCIDKTDPWKVLTDAIIDIKKLIAGKQQYFLDTYDDVKFHLRSSGILEVQKSQKQGEALMDIEVTYTETKWLIGESTYTVN